MLGNFKHREAFMWWLVDLQAAAVTYSYNVYIKVALMEKVIKILQE